MILYRLFDRYTIKKEDGAVIIVDDHSDSSISLKDGKCVVTYFGSLTPEQHRLALEEEIRRLKERGAGNLYPMVEYLKSLWE